MACIYNIYNKILLRHKKGGNPTFATTWMDPEVIMLSEISQMEKCKYGTNHTYLWSLKKTKTRRKGNEMCGYHK